MKINVVFNKNIPNHKDTLEVLENMLINKHVEFKSFSVDAPEPFGDFTITLGGDGTLLKASRFYAKYNTPILGINQGRLGFLSQAKETDIEEVLNSIIKNEYSTEDRMLLTAGNHLALNDFVIKGCNPSRTSKLYLEINGNCVCDYIADGLIISTPTGSTAYGLSAGGPVLTPTLDAISIVPICPHTLNARPLVVPSNEVISIKTGDAPLCIVADGTSVETEVEKVEITTAKYKAKLAFLNKGQFYSVLRNKLHWGISPEKI